MQRRICHIQYIRKTETEINIRLINHHKDVIRQIVPQVDQHFKLSNRNFIQHARFTLIEQQDSINIEKELATLQ